MNQVLGAESQLRYLRVGVVGIGSHMKENLFPALNDIREVEITAVASRQKEKAREYAQKQHTIRPFDDWRDLVTSGTVDAVVVAATPELHEQIIPACFEAGVHCYIEKPPARNLAALVDLANIEAAHCDTVCFVGFNYRFSDGYKLFERLHDSVPPIQRRLRFITSKPRTPWLGLASLQESYLLGVAIHALDLVISKFGPPMSVMPQWTKFTDDSFSLDLIVRFDGGRSSTLELGNYSNRFEFEIEDIFGPNDVALLRDQTSIEVVAHSDHPSSTPFAGKQIEIYQLPSSRGGYNRAGYTGALMSFVQSIQSGISSASTLSACLPLYNMMQQIIDAAV